MSEPTIAIDEWLKELECHSAESQEGLTAVEIVEMTGRSEKQVRMLLKKAHKNKLVEVKRVLRPRIDGIMGSLPVYIFKKK